MVLLWEKKWMMFLEGMEVRGNTFGIFELTVKNELLGLSLKKKIEHYQYLLHARFKSLN